MKKKRSEIMAIVILNRPIFRSFNSQTAVQFSFKKETGRTPVGRPFFALLNRRLLCSLASKKRSEGKFPNLDFEQSHFSPP